jgi:hypothetical protein
LDEKKGVYREATRTTGRLHRPRQETLQKYVQDIEEVAATLQLEGQPCAARQEKFEELIERFQRTKEPIHQQMVQVMTSFLAGLFVGEGKFEPIRDNLDLERWFRLPKSLERRIHEFLALSRSVEKNDLQFHLWSNRPGYHESRAMKTFINRNHEIRFAVPNENFQGPEGIGVDFSGSTT